MARKRNTPNHNLPRSYTHKSPWEGKRYYDYEVTDTRDGRIVANASGFSKKEVLERLRKGGFDTTTFEVKRVGTGTYHDPNY